MTRQEGRSHYGQLFLLFAHTSLAARDYLVLLLQLIADELQLLLGEAVWVLGFGFIESFEKLLFCLIETDIVLIFDDVEDNLVNGCLLVLPLLLPAHDLEHVLLLLNQPMHNLVSFFVSQGLVAVNALLLNNPE